MEYFQAKVMSIADDKVGLCYKEPALAREAKRHCVRNGVDKTRVNSESRCTPCYSEDKAIDTCNVIL